MSSERTAYEFLSSAYDCGKISKDFREHALMTRDIIAEIGGTERDRFYALLHEIPDVDIDAQEAVDERAMDQLRRVAQCMPDFLRHSDAEIAARSEALRTAPVATSILWLADQIDTFENVRIRFPLTGSGKEQADQIVHRCREAMAMTDVCARHPRFSAQVMRARSSIIWLSTMARTGALELSDAPPPEVCLRREI